MGKRGPPRKPTALKRLQGTYRPDREAVDEPQPTGDVDAPDCLSAAARAEWDRLAPALVTVGLLTVADRALFAVYCQAWADYGKLTDQLNEMASWVWQSEKGYRQVVPEVAMRREASVRMAQAAAKLGLDPSSRSGLHVVAGKREPNPFDRFVDKPPNKFARLREGRPNKFDGMGNVPA